MDEKTAVTVCGTLLVGLLGYAGKYANDLRLARRHDQLEHVSRQLKELYGPLLALCHSSSAAWSTFRRRYRPSGSYWRGDSQPTDEETAAWRLWMSEVFMPINVRIEDAIMRNADLVDGPEMPQPFIDLCAHVESYRVVKKKWDDEQFDEHVVPLGFPANLESHVAEAYKRLKVQQRILQGVSPKRP